MSFGEKRKLHEKFKFLVFSGEFGTAKFQKMGELSKEFAEIQYFEGGALIPIKDPGRLTYADTTLDRGSSQDYDFHNWADRVANAAVGDGGQGLVAPDFKTDDFSVRQLDRDNSTLREWDMIGVWAKKYVAGDWDNTADEVVIEMLTLSYDYYIPGGAGGGITTSARRI